MTRSGNERTRANELERDPGPWWRRIQWIDLVLVILGVIILLILTAELWLPHQAGGH